MFELRKRRKMLKYPIMFPGLNRWLLGSILGNVILLSYFGFQLYHDEIPTTFNFQPIQWHGQHSLSDGQAGSCYCNMQNFCLCTPSLAIDLVILSGSDHVWLVRRKDTSQLATMGGFVQVGETTEEAVRRELMEEMKIDLKEPPVLLGVYSDPRRDNRRHTVSATYAVRLDPQVQPVAADDVKDVQRIALADIENYSYFADHKTILTDFRDYYVLGKPREKQPVGGINSDIVRSICGAEDDWFQPRVDHP